MNSFMLPPTITYRVTFGGPPAMGKGEAMRALQRQYAPSKVGDLDPFEIDGTHLINLVMLQSAFSEDVGRDNLLRLITTIGPIQSEMPMNRLCDRANGMLFFARDAGPEARDAWDAIEQTLRKKDQSLSRIPVIVIRHDGERQDPEFATWIEQRSFTSLVLDPTTEDGIHEAMRTLLDEILRREAESMAEAANLFVPPDDVIIRSHRRSLISRLFGRKTG
ncbi:MAG: hypothetical protein MAG453_02033 [Calditrichaeota bacterium]|nr:hypothetical protein [Calditrichota bacterium]